MSTSPVPTISLVDSRPCTTSLAIAEHFGKNHQHVMRDIRALIADCPEEFHKSNFGLMSRKVKIGNGAEREEPFYNVFFDGFILLVMGYTGPKALQMKLAYIEAFNAMREKLEATPPTIPPSDQHTIRTLVKTIADRYSPEDQKAVYSQVWMRFRNHFHIASCKQLPPSKMAEAIAYLANFEVRGKTRKDTPPKALPPAYTPLAERGREALANILSLRRSLSSTSMDIMWIMQYAIHHGNVPALKDSRRAFSRELSSSITSFFMCINQNMIAIEHMFQAFCEAEKIIYES